MRSTLLTVVPGMLARGALQTLPGSSDSQKLGISPIMLTEEQITENRATLHELQIEHHDLNQVIDHLMQNPPPDDLLIRRLKKRKLLLKDRITLLEHLIEPEDRA
ncbi:MAG: DUF465 domain-containing protein [Candidatus Accumulibacter phosphatis]|nr:DUF465 domain-containing protein [Candidatus Accumulibacter contiguus]